MKKKSARRWAVELLVFLMIFMGVRLYLQRGTARGQAPPIGGTTLAGETVSLETLRGQTVLVHFWATWCAVCKREQGSIASFAADYPTVTIATQSGGDAAVTTYLDKHKLEIPVLVDPDGRIANTYGVSALPTSFIIDKSGRIRFTETGYTTEAGLRTRRWLADQLYE